MWLEVDAFDPVSLAAVRNGSAIPICSGENLYTNRGFRPFFEAGAMDVASVDVIWNGFHQAKKIADLAETFEVNCAPHNYYSHLATFISAQWCAAIPNVRILEVDVDDVPWREELTTAVPEIKDGKLTIPAGPGLGCRRERGRAARASVAGSMRGAPASRRLVARRSPRAAGLRPESREPQPPRRGDRARGRPAAESPTSVRRRRRSGRRT